MSTLQRRGLSIDGDNTYKRDLLDSVVDALALGAQDHNPHPEGHSGQRFWNIEPEERAAAEGLMADRAAAIAKAELHTKGSEDAAQRASACLVACKGISTPALVRGRLSSDVINTEESRADKAEHQRDDLLAAAQESLAVINRFKPEKNGNGTQVRLAKAIAKATE